MVSLGNLLFSSVPQQVSDVVVHPEFYPAGDNVAVLKLKDKAKISERVLPVCLPRMQRGEVTSQEAYTVRWILPSNHRHLGHFTAVSQTKVVELSDRAECEREFAQGGTHTTEISDNVLCVIRKPSSPESPCPSVIPGLTVVPAGFSSTSGVLSGHEETQETSGIGWQLLGLESFNTEEKNCHRQTYTLQTQISRFQLWIEEMMKWMFVLFVFVFHTS